MCFVDRTCIIVILSEAKDLSICNQILRCAQNDRAARPYVKTHTQKTRPGEFPGGFAKKL